MFATFPKTFAPMRRFMSTFLSREDVGKLGLKHVGANVQISSTAVFHNPNFVSVGRNSRIDDYTVISAGVGGIHIGDFVHVASHVKLVGKASIHLDNFSGVSSHCAIYSSNDDYSGIHLTGPTVPEVYRLVKSEPVKLGKHVVVGTHSVLLPGVTVGLGACVGAFSLVSRSLPEFKVCFGNPCKPVRARALDTLELEMKFLQDKQDLVKFSYSEKVVVDEKRVRLFANASGDQNPIHLDERVAVQSRFKARVAHDMLCASFFSSIFTKLWPGSIYSFQSLTFLRPIFLNTSVRVAVELLEPDKERNQLYLKTTVTSLDNPEICFLDGRAELAIDGKQMEDLLTRKTE